MSMLYVAAAVSAVIGGISSYRQTQAQQAQFEANANAANYNAQVQKQQADAAQSSANAQEEQQLRSNRIMRGKRNAAIAESGLGFSGSNLDVASQGDIFAELDALNIRYKGQLEATGYGNQATLSDYDTNVARGMSARAGRSIFLNTAAGALASGSSAYGTFAMGRRGVG